MANDSIIQPSAKSPATTALLEGLTGRKRDGRVCMTCGSENVGADSFRDELSRREFSISQMCQVCQDSAFGECEEGCGHDHGGDEVADIDDPTLWPR